jgi:hypothetical protein
MTRGNGALITRSALATLCLFALAACTSGKPQAAPTTTTAPKETTTGPATTRAATTPGTTITAPAAALPPVSFGSLPVPSDYTCPAGLYFLAPANQAVGVCVPYAYLVGGTASDPDNDTACPAGSLMTMGPVECGNDTGIVTPVPPGPDTCSTPGEPCPSGHLPLSSQASVIPSSALQHPTGKCPGGYYFGETIGVATCVPYDYVPGGTPANPNNNTACPAGSGLTVLQLTGTLCTQDSSPHDIVAPVPAASL